MKQEPWEIHWKDYYQILKVQKTASDLEIKKSYRDLAIQYHPDKTKGNSELEEKFKEINEAYRILSDRERKQKYDNYYNYVTQTSSKQSSNKYNNYVDEYEFLRKLFVIYYMNKEINYLKGKILKHKIKLFIAFSSIFYEIFHTINNYKDYQLIIEMLKNKEKLYTGTISTLALHTFITFAGICLLYKEGKFDTTEHLNRISELEREMIKNL